MDSRIPQWRGGLVTMATSWDTGHGQGIEVASGVLRIWESLSLQVLQYGTRDFVVTCSELHVLG